jgi:hypothetical protein
MLLKEQSHSSKAISNLLHSLQKFGSRILSFFAAKKITKKLSERSAEQQKVFAVNTKIFDRLECESDPSLNANHVIQGVEMSFHFFLSAENFKKFVLRVEASLCTPLF